MYGGKNDGLSKSVTNRFRPGGNRNQPISPNTFDLDDCDDGIFEDLPPQNTAGNDYPQIRETKGLVTDGPAFTEGNDVLGPQVP